MSRVLASLLTRSHPSTLISIPKKTLASMTASTMPTTAHIKMSPAEIHPEITKVIPGYPSLIHIPVQWGDQDAFGHLNNVIYFRYFETARIDYMQAASAHFPEAFRTVMLRPSQTEPGPIVSHLTTRYHAQVHFPDTLTYLTRLAAKDVQESLYNPACDRMTLEYVAYSNKMGRKVASGTCQVVSFHYGKQTKMPFPLYVRRGLYDFEASAKESGVKPDTPPEL